METNIFSPMEIDAIGEIMNISLGSSATAVSNMLDHRVDITTPTVAVINAEEFTLGKLEPAIGVEIRYVSGLEGSNIMLLKRSDVKTIVDILMGTETPEEEFELNDLTVSAVCEVMNQMMGAASTALSDFLGKPVNISTPESFELDDFAQFKKEHFPAESGKVAVVRFMLSIEGALESEFINVMSINLARELISGFGLETAEEAEMAPPAPAGEEPAPIPAPAPTQEAAQGGALSQEEIERLLQGQAAPAAPARQEGGAPQPRAEEPAPAAQPYAGGVPGGYPPPYAQPAPGYYPPPPYYYPPAPPEPKLINTQPAPMPQLEGGERLDREQAENLDLIMSVPLEVSVEIGRTRRKIQDILAFSKGSLVVLDKLAGDQVDLFVNGQCIARGDVVVIEDNFGIRITEILKNPELSLAEHV